MLMSSQQNTLQFVNLIKQTIAKVAFNKMALVNSCQFICVSSQSKMVTLLQ